MKLDPLVAFLALVVLAVGLAGVSVFVDLGPGSAGNHDGRLLPCEGDEAVTLREIREGFLGAPLVTRDTLVWAEWATYRDLAKAAGSRVRAMNLSTGEITELWDGPGDVRRLEASQGKVTWLGPDASGQRAALYLMDMGTGERSIVPTKDVRLLDLRGYDGRYALVVRGQPDAAVLSLIDETTGAVTDVYAGDPGTTEVDDGRVVYRAYEENATQPETLRLFDVRTGNTSVLVRQEEAIYEPDIWQDRVVYVHDGDLREVRLVSIHGDSPEVVAGPVEHPGFTMRARPVVGSHGIAYVDDTGQGDRIVVHDLSTNTARVVAHDFVNAPYTSGQIVVWKQDDGRVDRIRGACIV